MDQVKVNVVQFEVLEGLFAGGHDDVSFVERVPKLGDDEEFVASYIAGSNLLAYRRAYFGLVAIKHSAVEVAVADVDGIFYCLTDFSRGSLKKYPVYTYVRRFKKNYIILICCGLHAYLF